MSETIRQEDAYAWLGSRPMAWLVEHFSIWQNKAKVKVAGERWVVRTTQELIENFKAPFAPATLRRAIRKLKELGILQLSYRPHPFSPKILHATWVRLSWEKIKMISLKGSPCALKKDQDDPSNNQEDTTGNTTGSNMASQAQPPAKKKPMVIGKMTSDDLKGQFKHKKPKKESALNPTNLFMLIRAVQNETDPEHPVGSASMATKGKVGHILKYLRNTEKLDDDSIKECVEYVVENWGSFVSFMFSAQKKDIQAPFFKIEKLLTNIGHVRLFWRTEITNDSQYEAKPGNSEEDDQFDYSDWD